MHGLFDSLNKPFPFFSNNNQKWVASISFGSFIFFFLVVFQPFGINDIKIPITLYVLGFSIITCISLWIAFFILPWIFRDFFRKGKWTVGKSFIFSLGIMLSISLFNFSYYQAFSTETNTHHTILGFLFITASIGIIPLAFLLFFLEFIFEKSNSLVATEINETIDNHSFKLITEIISLPSENKNESLSLPLDQLICIKSEGNYVNVFYISNSSLQSKMLRSSIGNLEKQLLAFDHIYRCHRSFLINIHQVKSVSGNARDFTLFMNLLNFNVPVSRKFPKSIFQSKSNGTPHS
jgi:hypothetical protein